MLFALLDSRSLHADPLVRTPVPLFDSVGLIDPPDTSMDGLPTWRRVGSYGDFPVAGLVDEAVADLELHGEQAGRGGRRRLMRGWQRELPARFSFAFLPSLRPRHYSLRLE